MQGQITVRSTSEESILIYVEGIKEKISGLLRMRDIGTLFNTDKTTKSFLGKGKHKISLRKEGTTVNYAPAGCHISSDRYDGINSHRQKCPSNRDPRSAIALHSENSGHLISFIEANIFL